MLSYDQPEGLKLNKGTKFAEIVRVNQGTHKILKKPRL